MKRTIPVFVLSLLIAIASSASAQQLIDVKVETLGTVGLAPSIVGFSDGSFDIFNVGSAVSDALEALAETGTPAGFAPSSGGGLLGPGVSPTSPPIFGPGGAMATQRFTVAAGDTMFNLAAMVLPSNDWFIGNDNAFDVSSLFGAANGTSLTFEFSTVYDAGTELEEFASGPGGGLFGIAAMNGDPDVGTNQNGVVSVVGGPDPYAAHADVPTGFDTLARDFTTGPIARVTLTSVPEPTSMGLLGFMLVSCLGLIRKQRA